jgi:hypothetical protein
MAIAGSRLHLAFTDVGDCSIVNNILTRDAGSQLYGTSMPGAGAVHCIRFMTIEDSRDDNRSDPPRWCPLADGVQADLASIGA